MAQKKCKIMRPPKFIEAAKHVIVIGCSDNQGRKDKLGQFFVGDKLISMTLENGLVVLAKKIANGRTAETKFNSEYSDDDLDCGLELDFYKDKKGFFKTTELRVKIDFTSVINSPKAFSSKTERRQVSFSSFYSVQENVATGTLLLNQIELEQWQPYTNEFTNQKIEMKFSN